MSINLYLLTCVSLVTPATSLIVLETLEQVLVMMCCSKHIKYLKHEICPPLALEEIRTEWLKIMETKWAQKRDKEEAKLKRVLDLWDRRIQVAKISQH